MPFPKQPKPTTWVDERGVTRRITRRRAASKTRRDAKRAAYEVARAACRQQVIIREQARCRVCLRHASDVGGQVHEVVPRSQGGDPTNPKEGVLVCNNDHRDLTEHRTRLAVADPTQGTDGPLLFTDKDGTTRYV